MISARIQSIETLADNIKTFWFKPDEPVRYQAGQFTELFLDMPGKDKRGKSREFTLSSSPTESLLAVTSKMSNPSSPYKSALWAVQPGDQIKITEPMGDFVLPKNPNLPLVFIAAGIGVTPVRSIAKFLLDTKETRNVTIIYRPADDQELIFKDDLTAASTNLILPEGRITTELILTSSPTNALFYISGPQAMSEQLANRLADSGVASENIITDYFLGYDIS